MAATVAGALKAMIEAAGLGVPVYRETVPAGASMPYVLVYENIATLQQGSWYDTETRIVETVQVDLWQSRENENYTVRDALTRLLSSGRPGHAGSSPIRQLKIAASNRLPNTDPTVLGHSWNVDVWRAVA